MARQKLVEMPCERDWKKSESLCTDLLIIDVSVVYKLNVFV